MVNLYLKKTSSACALIHIGGIIYYQPPVRYSLFLITCVTVSIANHSYTSNFLKYIDRTCMTVGMPITYYLSPNSITRYTTALVGVIYLLGKYYKNYYIHSISHYIITIINIIILQSFV